MMRKVKLEDVTIGDVLWYNGASNKIEHGKCPVYEDAQGLFIFVRNPSDDLTDKCYLDAMMEKDMIHLNGFVWG